MTHESTGQSLLTLSRQYTGQCSGFVALSVDVDVAIAEGKDCLAGT